MTKSKIKTTFEDDFDEEEKLSPEDQATWDEMEKYFSESLHQFKEGQVIQGTVIELAKGMATIDVGFKSEGNIHLHEFSNNGQDLSVGDEVEVFLERSEDNEGNVVLSKEKANKIKLWDELATKFDAKKLLMAPLSRKQKVG